MTISGKLVEIYDAKQLTDKFKKREFVVEYSENALYPQFIKFELTQNNCDLLEGYSKGNFIEVHFDLRGKPWVNKQGETTYFTSLSVWKIKTSTDQSNSPDMNQEPENLSDEDLPF